MIPLHTSRLHQRRAHDDSASGAAGAG